MTSSTALRSGRRAFTYARDMDRAYGQVGQTKMEEEESDGAPEDAAGAIWRSVPSRGQNHMARADCLGSQDCEL
eukprot:CAMPEP_0113539980 /NCGR_PEP_ID=MMETSP0015_2-20120614/8226_1 /TAXON_ID=2838 /ORGANISM="Odontella" /LENGTH=73 /DNA_ID=CAMNT_0000439733 /DNA_START=819 /DNA_END=1040 /DNA_ORIENTATION=+ /assembly_acc=CAM_ASM_000160